MLRRKKELKQDLMPAICCHAPDGKGWDALTQVALKSHLYLHVTVTANASGQLEIES